MKTKNIVSEFINIAGDKISDESSIKAIDFLLKTFIADMNDLRTLRNIKFDRGLVPIFNDMNKKWKNCAFKINTKYGFDVLKMNGFNIILKQFFPDAHVYYLAQNK